MRLLPAPSNAKLDHSPWLRAHVWVPAHCFFSRSDAQSNCWLWLLLDNGQVRALLLPALQLGNDALLPELARLCALDENRITALPGLERACILPHAPIVPLPRWAVSWGHPVQRAIRRFAEQLNAKVLDALGNLESPQVFFGSVDNYNALIRVSAQQRERRLQALADFPAWLAPILLAPLARPAMFPDGYDEDSRYWHAPSHYPGLLDATGNGYRWARPDPRLLDAIDRGRDLIGAIASACGVDRALVRSPLGRQPWPQGYIPPIVMALLQALPAHARPRHRDEVVPHLIALDAIPARMDSRADVKRLATAFAGGWNAVWKTLTREHAALPQTLRDCHDFLRVALETAPLPIALTGMTVGRLALAWCARRGPGALLAASRHWHALPLVTPPLPPEPGETLVPLFDQLQLAQGNARELLDMKALLEEGQTMTHCVGDYWGICLQDGHRIVHLQTHTGERATLQIALNFNAPRPAFRQVQLSGPRNDTVSDAVQALARAVIARLSAGGDAMAERFARARQQSLDARKFQTALRKSHQPWRPLDRRLRSELQQVLAYAEKQADWCLPERETWIGQIAGFRYTHGPLLMHQLHPGEPLTLVPEQDNPHDAQAVRIDWCGHKLGYVPRTDSALVARLLAAGHTLTARIHALHDNDWGPVEFVIER